MSTRKERIEKLNWYNFIFRLKKLLLEILDCCDATSLVLVSAAPTNLDPCVDDPASVEPVNTYYTTSLPLDVGNIVFSDSLGENVLTQGIYSTGVEFFNIDGNGVVIDLPGCI